MDLFRYAIGMFGSLAIIWTSLLLYKALQDNNMIKRLLESLGADSLAIYVLSLSIQSFWLPIIMKKVLQFLPSLDWNRIILIYSLIITPIISIGYSYLLLGAINVMKRIGIYRLFFGRSIPYTPFFQMSQK